LLRDSSSSPVANPTDTTLLVAHANSLRALVMHLDGISVEDIESVNTPTAIPFYYDISVETGQVVGTNQPRGSFRGNYISDAQKQRTFLERRRAANDPWLWALHDHQVDKSMLLRESRLATEDVDTKPNDQSSPYGLEGANEEARRNTYVFTSALGNPESNTR